LHQKILEKSKNGDDLSIIMLVFKQIIEANEGCQLFFCEHSSVKTQLTTKIFTTNYLKRFTKFEEVLEET
jgi:hypothetical protein